MALALAQYEDLFQLVRDYLYGVRMACQIGYRTTSTECKTGISAMLTVTSGLGTLMEQMITKNYPFILFLILAYIDHVFTMGL